ncbi:spore coat protein CotF [Salirhabdus euzebyi]|uniref:Spore coat protein CotF n=1 Tax=Salirhabdus euzebyi TaxID=394506 RepID=A0A841Q444_9BACI|nr:hypothetical protein [Salirhabdus euzebyi]MBB6453132.1 spore coat protein CotF [Salirhabdus euzebyi]
MSLPAIDVGLMNEHLTTHQGVIHKLKHYYSEVKDPYLKQIIYAQAVIMRDHVKVMLALLDPNNNQWKQVVPLKQVFSRLQLELITPHQHNEDKKIVLENHSTAKFLATDNFLAALMMKNDNVKQVHYDMAMQQANFEKMYSDYINKMGWSVTATANEEEQVKLINHFKRK